MRVCELREKEVINVCDGERLGNVCDVDFDVKTGRILSLIIPGPCKVFGILGRDYEYIIPYECYIINVFRNIVRIFLIIVKGGISYEMSFLRSR